MSTEYTAPIFEDPDFTFTDYAWRCARAMRVCAEMRDAPMDQRPPKKFEVPLAVAARPPKAQTELMQARCITIEEAAATAKAEHIAAMEDWAEQAAEAEQNAERWEAMWQAVSQWVDPDPMEGLKVFMLDQLKISKSDCARPKQPQEITGERWRYDQIAVAELRLAQAHAQLGAKIKAVSERNEWLRRLRVALGEP